MSTHACPPFHKAAATLLICGVNSFNIFLHLQLFKKFKVPGPAKSMGRGKEWNVDLIPKFFLTNGESWVLFMWTCDFVGIISA